MAPPDSKTHFEVEVSQNNAVCGAKYSRTRMDQVKFVEDSLSKNWQDMVCLSRFYKFTWSILEYFASYMTHINKSYIRLDINCDWFWFFLLIRCFLVLSNSCIKSLPSGWLRRGLLTFCNLPFCYCALKWDLFIYFIAHITFYHEGYYTKVKG